MQHGGRPPYITNRWIAISQRKIIPILIKFDPQQHIWNSMTATWPNTIFFKIQDGGLTPYWKFYINHNSAADCPMSLKFCVGKQFFSHSATKQIPMFHRTYFCRAMLCISAAYAVMRCLSVCLCVCLSRSWIMSKRIKISSNFFCHRVATPF